MMLVVFNKHELSQAANAVRLAEVLIETIGGSAPVQRVDRLDDPVGNFTSKWMLFGQETGGFALNIKHSNVQCSLLNEKLAFVRNAKSIARFLDENSSDDLLLHLVDNYPSSWSSYRLMSDNSEIFIALNDGAQSLLNITQPEIYRMVRLPLHALISWSGSIHVGAAVDLPELVVLCQEQQIAARFLFSSEGVISMERSNEMNSMSDSVMVQLNLGEIELSLSQLAALRSGSRIELDAQVPFKCALRIGATTLATGEINQIDNRLSVRILEIY
jgi:flagellar motor switch/type III secretory pathway protein FliN